VEEGRLVVGGFDPETVGLFAKTPDGALAYVGFQPAMGTRTGVAAFRAPRRLIVRVLDDGDNPVGGATVSMGYFGPSYGLGPSATDETGTARWTGAYGDRIPLYVTTPGVDPSRRYVGEVKLSQGDAGLRVRIPPVRDVVFQVTLNEEPGLPSDYKVQLRGFTDFVDCRHVTDAAEASELHLRVRPWARKRLWFRIDAPGYFMEEQNVPLSRNGPTRVAVPLVSACRLLVVIRGREGSWMDNPVQLQRYDPDGEYRKRMRLRYPRNARFREGRGDWTWTFMHGEQDAQGRNWLKGLYPGRYRLVHEGGKEARSEEIELRPGEDGRLIIELD